ncbi:Fc receptor-like B [Carlito syrichta]|uniref:Fc receptor-like B n=1 Tax=Carlito syrichta TaxID=1868482 RepID=A0A1U7UFT8_CARSF|nr:Fc receptor-like B [Carlito syrichta]
MYPNFGIEERPTLGRKTLKQTLVTALPVGIPWSTQKLLGCNSHSELWLSVSLCLRQSLAMGVVWHLPRGEDPSGTTLSCSPLDLGSTTAPTPQASAPAPGSKSLSFRRPPMSRSVTSVPNTTSAGQGLLAGGAATAGPPVCVPPTPLEQSTGGLKSDVDLLLREMQLLKGLLSRVVLELKESQALPELRGTPETSTSRLVVSPGTLEATPVES